MRRIARCTTHRYLDVARRTSRTANRCRWRFTTAVDALLAADALVVPVAPFLQATELHRYVILLTAPEYCGSASSNIFTECIDGLLHGCVVTSHALTTGVNLGNQAARINTPKRVANVRI